MRIKLVIDELATTVEPLKEQSIVAQKYLNIKGELESIDIALIAKDITDLNLEYTKITEEIKNLKEKLLTLKDSSEDSKLETLKFRSLELEENLNKKKEELLKVTENLSDLNGEKKLTIERQKYETNNDVLENNLIKLKEKELELNKSITLCEREVLDIENTRLEVHRATVLCSSGTQLNRRVKFALDEDEIKPDRCIYFIEK